MKIGKLTSGEVGDGREQSDRVWLEGRGKNGRVGREGKEEKVGRREGGEIVGMVMRGRSDRVLREGRGREGR